MGQAREAASLRPFPADARRLIDAGARPWLRGSGGRTLLRLAGLALAFGGIARAVDSPQPIPAAALVALFTAAAVHSRYRLALAELRFGWAAGLPVTENARRLAAALPLLAASTLAAAVSALATWPAWPRPVALALFLGGVVGSGLALLWPRFEPPGPYPQSRYRGSRPRARSDGSFLPVVQDLHAAVAVRLQPRSLARTVAPLLLVLPAGLPLFDAAAAVVGLAAAIYASALIATLRPFARTMCRWLDATPLDARALRSSLHRSVRGRLGLALVGSLPLLIAALGPWRAAGLVLPGLLVLDFWIAACLRAVGAPR